MKFIYSLQSEWLKTKRSAASWLCIIGGFFIPTIYLIYFLVKSKTIVEADAAGNVWELHFFSLMQNMKAFLLPMGVIMASSLITQMEFKNNTWKQLHTTPQSLTTIFLAKFSVIAIMTVKFFVFFSIGVILSGLIPCLIVNGKLPEDSFPFWFFIKENIKVFILCLPIMAIQYLISLRFKNFLVPVGIGLIGLIGSMIGSMWEYIYISPYSYVFLDHLRNVKVFTGKITINLYQEASIYFVLLMAISYVMFHYKKEKG